MNSSSISYKRHRFPPQIIAHAVWLYTRFNLSLREVEEMPLQRGITEVQNGGTPDNGRTLRQLGYKDADRRAETRQADRAVVIKGAMDGPAFTAYIREVLIPEIVPGAVVILDDLATHRNKEAAQSLRDHGCWFLYLPPYSPDLNPIERAFSTLRAHLRRIGARTFKEVFEAICVVWFS